MLTIKWTQSSGIIALFQCKTASVILPRTDAWDEHRRENPDLEMDNVRGIVMVEEEGTIVVRIGEGRLYIVNDNGKTVQTV